MPKEIHSYQCDVCRKEYTRLWRAEECEEQCKAAMKRVLDSPPRFKST